MQAKNFIIYGDGYALGSLPKSNEISYGEPYPLIITVISLPWLCHCHDHCHSFLWWSLQKGNLHWNQRKYSRRLMFFYANNLFYMLLYLLRFLFFALLLEHIYMHLFILLLVFFRYLRTSLLTYFTLSSVLYLPCCSFMHTSLRLESLLVFGFLRFKMRKLTSIKQDLMTYYCGTEVQLKF